MTERTVLDDATAEHWQMVTDNTGLVWRLVHRMRLAESQRDDAYQDGLFGLLRAAMLYDPSKGFTFSTYANAWILQAIERGRGRLEGCNYRRATVGRSWREWEPPRSLDAELAPSGHEDAGTLADFLQADDIDPADVAHLAASMDSAAARLLRGCRDALDLDIMAAMVADEGGGCVTRIAEDHQVTRTTVYNRRHRLRDLARPHFEEAA